MPLSAWISARYITLLTGFLAGLLPATIAPLQAAPADQALYSQGEKLFKGNCASCHKPDKDATGPALKGARARWEGQGDIYAWIKNSAAYLKTGNAYANKLFQDWKQSPMTAQAVTNEEIDAILYYADNYEPPPPPAPPPVGGGTTPESPADAGEAWPWMVVLALLFLVVALSLNGVRKSLANAVREAKGKPPLPERGFWGGLRHWAWNNKVFASILGLFIFTWVCVKLWNMAWVIGVYGGDGVPNYKPSQPIAFNHTLHAGKDNLAIHCQYCHSSAEKSRHAGIPSANVCMNCHKDVSEGKVTGKAEIAKIYEAVGWDPERREYTGEEKPIQWTKVHVLPDHAFFSHAHHVAVAKLECQECHGPVDTQMDVAEQWAPLTMGWCLDCHNQRSPQLEGSAYYDEVSRRLHESDLGHRELKKYLEDGKITVRELGGWECAKCHY